MAQYLNLPSGNSILLGEGEDPQQAYLRALKEYPEEFGFQKPSTAKGGFGAAFSAGLSRLGGEAALTAGKAGLLDTGRAEEIYRRQQKKAEGIFKPTEGGWTEDPLRKLSELAGGSAAYMLAPAAAGITALAAPVVIPGTAAAVGVGALGAGLAGLTGVGQYTGSNLAAQMEEGKKSLAETSGAAAVGAAIPQAALDVLSFKMLPGVKRLFGSVGKEVTEDQAKAIAAQTLRQKIGDYTAATGLAMGVEGATEVAQDMLEKLQAGAELTDPKAREDYIENFIGGAALAGVLGPFGRGVERAGIQARGRELEAKRLDEERKAELAAKQKAAGEEATQQFGTLFPEIGPASSLTATPNAQVAQARLAQIEKEAEAARQAKDMDALLRLQRERTALESQVKEQPSGMEQRQALEQQLAYYQSIETRLIEQAKAAPTADEKRPVLEKLVAVQNERRRLTNALEQQEKTGAIPALKTQAGLLRQEKATISALQKAEDAGDAAAQLKLADKLSDLQQQLGLFGQEAYTAQQQFETKQAEDAAAAEAAAKAAQPVLRLTDQRGATPIPMGYNIDTIPTPPRTPQAYLQGNLFGSEERVQVPGGTETTLPALQQTVSSLSERPDLSPEDRSLLDRVSDLVLPKQQVSTVPGVQKELDALAERQRNVASAIEQKRGAPIRLQQRLAALQQQIAAYKTEKARLNEQFRQTRKSTLAQVQEAGPPTSETVAAAAKQEQELVDVRAKAIENDAQLAQAEASLRALTKKEADVRQRTDRSIAKLERLQENLRKELSMRAAQRDTLPSTAAPIERFTTPLEVRDVEGNVKTRATPAQLVADFVQDLSRGSDTTRSRAALEDALPMIQRAGAGEKEPLTKAKRRLATPEERAALGKKSVLEQVPTAVTKTAQQPDLFAGTEAARATEFETPKEMQAFMASEALQKQRAAEAERGLTEAQKAGPPTPTDIGRFKKLMQPTVAFLNKQADKVRGFLGALNKKLETFKVLKQVQGEENEARMLAAKAQQTEVLLAMEKAFLKAHLDYARAVLEMKNAQSTYDGLQDFYDKAQAAFDTIMRMSDEWASVAAKEDARFKEGLQERHEEFRRALGRLGVLRGEISNKFGDILSMKAPALEAGAAFDPELVQSYTTAKTAADKAATEFYTYVRSRQKPETPASWRVTNKDIKQFLAQDIELLHMLEEQAKVVKYWRYTADEFEDKLSAAREAAKADPVWAAFLKEAQDAVDEATRLDKDGKLRSPDKLMAAIRSANTQLRAIRDQQRESPQLQIRELEIQRDKISRYSPEEKLEIDQLNVEASKAAKARIDAGKREKLKAIDSQLAVLRKQVASTSVSKIADQRKETAKKTVAKMRTENERRAREATVTRSIIFGKVLSESEQERLADAIEKRDKLVAAKDAEIKAKQEQKKNMRLSPGRRKAIAEKQMTRAEAVESQRAADIENIKNKFNAAIESEEATISALKNEPSSLKSLDWKGVAPSEMTEKMQEELLTDAEKKEISDGTKTLEQVLEAQKRTGRTGRTLVDIRTGRVSEGKRAVSSRDLTDAQQTVETAEVNRLAAEQHAREDKRHRNELLRYAYDVFRKDLRDLDTDALEFEVLNLQAKDAEKAARLTKKAHVKIAREVTEGERAPVGSAEDYEGKNPYNRLLSHDYAGRENTPLDETTTAAVNKGDLKGALEALAKNGSTPFVRMVAQRLLPMVENTTLETAALKGKGGEYDPNTDTVTLNKDALTEEDLIHEPTHAATIGVIDAKPETLTKEQLAARTALEKLYAKMQGRPEFKDEYANISFKEFVSELLSNQQVRDKVNQTAGLLRRIYEGFLRMLGIEPTTLSDKAAEQAFAMFSPSTVSVNKEARLASIMRGTFPGTASTFSSTVPKSISDMVNRTIARNATLGDKITANLTGLRMRTFIADQWAPVEALMKMGVAKGKIKEAQALQMQVYMRLFSNMQEYTNSALLNGVPELRKDTAGIRTIEGGDKDVNARTIAKALSKASAVGNQQAVERMFTLWMASLRAKQDGVGLNKLNFKSPPTAKELADLEQFLKDNSTVKDAFEEARALYKQHNKRLLDLQVQTGAMSPDVAKELATGDYIGFYRVNNNGVVELMLGGSRPVRVGNVIDQPYLKELVGGEQQILPFFASMTQNTSLLMSMALKNMQHTNTAYMFQDLGLGKIHSAPEGKEPPLGKMRFKQAGNDYWFQEDADAFGNMDVPFDLVMQGLQGVKTAIPSLVRALAVPADLLRKTVRRMPLYTLRQTIRDPMHAWLTTGGNFVPVLSTWKEMYRGMTNQSTTQISLKEAAVVGNHVYSGDTEGVTKMLRELGTDPSRFSQIMAKLDEFAMQGEAATRAVLYDDFRKRGMSHVEALLSTAETMNFSRRGTSASLHWLAQLTPFFNAQIQGLDAAYRALKGDTTFEEKLNARNTLLKRGALMAASTMAYALLMEDDETYKNSTPEERYSNWFVRVPGTDNTLRVPIPFELGLIFKSIPEAFINVAFGDKKAEEATKALAKQVYMSSPFGVPTALKGPLEVAFNYNMYTDQPIETARERALDVDQRYRDSTTELAKLLGKAGILSPVQLDHLVRSYTGSMGIMLLSTANMALRPLVGKTDVEKPEMSINEMPVIGSAFQPTTGRGMVNAAFDEMSKFQRAAMTYKSLATTDPEAAREYANKFGREIALASTGGSFRQQMGEFAQYKRAVAANPALTGAQKREQIDAIKRQEIEFAQRLRKLAA